MNNYIHKDIGEIVKSVSRITGIHEGIMLSKTRKRHIKDARFLAMYYSRINRGYTLMVIAEWFDKDHTTVINAVKIIENLMEKDVVLQDHYKSLCKDIELNKVYGSRYSSELTHTWETFKQVENQL